MDKKSKLRKILSDFKMVGVKYKLEFDGEYTLLIVSDDKVNWKQGIDTSKIYFDSCGEVVRTEITFKPEVESILREFKSDDERKNFLKNFNRNELE